MGRIHVSGRVAKRGERKKVDFLLEYRPNLPIALIEAKSAVKDLGAGMQQGLGYAASLDVPFVFSANGFTTLTAAGKDFCKRFKL